jgi:hypothetical protein
MKASVEKGSVTRINENVTFSGLCRFIDVDIASGRSTVMVHNRAYTPAPVTVSISYGETVRIMSIAGRGEHARFVNGRSAVLIVDRWIVDEIVNQEQV